LSKNQDIQCLRAVAIAMVLLHHIGGKIPGVSLGLWIRQHMGFYVGVELFLVISGFVITRSLIRSGSLGDGKRLSGDEFRAFWKRRFFRLLPASVLWLCLGMAVVPLLDTSASVLVQNGRASLFALTGTYNILNAYCLAYGLYGTFCPSISITHVYWSLSLEEQFYLALTIALMWLSPVRFLATAGVVLGVVYLAVTYHPSNLTSIAYMIANRSYGLFLGCGLGLLPARYGSDIAKAIPRTIRSLILFGGMLAVALLAKSDTVAATLGVSLVCMGMVFAALGDGALSRGRAGEALVWIGERSYAFYLCHVTVLYLAGLLYHAVDAARPELQATGILGPVCFLAGLLCSVVAADLTYRFVEIPFMRAADRKRRSTAAQAELPNGLST
jgi:peptidoglycan/LPS O-acetylase OafA/YrhL